MNKDNVIGIVATIKEKPRLIIDAQDWRLRVYETKIERLRPGKDKSDTFILRYNGKAAGSEEALEIINEGVEVLIGGEVRSKNVKNPTAEENKVIIYIFAEVIAVNDPPADQQNEVYLCGRICKTPRVRLKRCRIFGKKEITITDIIVAVNGRSGANYIPCACWDTQAKVAAELKIGTYVEIIGRLQSHTFIKRIVGRETPFLCINYGVNVCELGYEAQEGE